jgi:hypothetical protein
VTYQKEVYALIVEMTRALFNLKEDIDDFDKAQDIAAELTGPMLGIIESLAREEGRREEE